MQLEQFNYDNKIVRNFGIATIIWGIVGMSIGLLVATQLVWPAMNFGIQFSTFGRIRPVHTNAIIFAFVGNAIFMGVYYSLQRVLRARMFSDALSKIHFWGWQLVIVASAITLPLGLTTSHEYAEMEWPIDLGITIIWVVFGINMFGTIIKRRERHMYVAVWFYIATFVTVAVLHIVNSVQLPVSGWKSYYVYSGVQDALVQWWYGHNAVAFFLTTPFLGMMYYFLPKMANRPVYSYKLSILHFWSLIFIYIWAGPHHLLYTALPGWVQSLGVAFSIMLIAPSWGGMINGLLTLRGAWDKVRTEPILKFMVVALTCYGMATFEGPMLSLKQVNAIAHFTDWIVAHVHVGALGWNGFMTFAILYWLIPRIYKTELYSKKLASVHFWIGTLGILFYAIPMYWAAVVQGLMWKEFTPEGVLKYPNFLATTLEIIPMHMMRAVGGALYLSGAILMTFNLVKTMRQGKLLADEPAQAPALLPVTTNEQSKHRRLERKPVMFMVLALIAILIGGIVEMIPTFTISSNIPTIASVKPYTALELQGRDLYIREGCVNCHTQSIRPFRSETARYGEYSKAGEYVYDHPFLWGSKRTGPDLHRIGGKYPNKWHFDHLLDPTITSPGSIMPTYPWLIDQELDNSLLTAKLEAMKKLGVPYTDQQIDQAQSALDKQAQEIAADLKKNQVNVLPNREIIAMIAYLQRLGTDIKAEPKVAEKVDELN
ncbi:cytochrome-c oxidase, cbb3-type subunit I [Sphingobacterium faecium]|jgi:cytochrome c oxidase cbb3-type subunit I/II|uniref:cytochrome-c oxidase, cbb3-type subunit I n=1 Tax=Sphingobacterium faecium TaxID=34087 RepID=UPI0004E5FB4D|nr:cytochrome-c oxidase, cbb3-type subunit I [Sphingobacterium faecium]WGQ15943.1 cytochrome-c oxidase, cbb3-type subunit I [Sphingobacterium faecium]CDS92876.1 Cb-type cytochrome c oxidase subunit I [Sphingobacterium sp. PM2-P1-29]SJN48993.1 Cytochrome c oxidase subunit CcoN / Cytochrome c oxidase subunit CcoO [Sphingobacterium faecium PCAi_F2.5]HCU44969.1 cytochrome-c oxidase, cbb3-type subunit I [Sphingobacterium sp.]